MDIALDKKHDPVEGDDTYDYGDVFQEASLGIVLEHWPWAGDHIDPLNREEIFDWPDTGYPPSTQGRFFHDGSWGESAVMYWNLTDLLVNTQGNEDVTDIRVRIVDNNPMNGIKGN